MHDAPTPSDQSSWRRARGAYPGWQIAASFLLGWIFVITGALGSLYAPVSAWRTHEFVRTAVHAKAPIVAFQTYPPGRHESHETYRPIIEVPRAHGQTVRRLVGVSAFPTPYRVGDEIDILHAPGDPASAVRDRTEDIWGLTLFFAIVPPIVLIVGVGIIGWMRYFVSHPPEQLAWIDRWFIPLKLLTRE